MPRKARRKPAKATRAAPAPATYRWSIYRLRGTPAAFVGIIDDAPDAATALRRAAEELPIAANLRGRLMAVREQ